MRPIIEFASPVFNPRKKSLIDKLEKIQKIALKSIFLRSKELKPYFNAPYKEKLEIIQLESLEDRRNKSDLILLNNCLIGNNPFKINLKIVDSKTRGSKTKFIKPSAKKNILRHFFTFRACQSYEKIPRELQYSSSKVFKNFIKYYKFKS